mgnify:CR=1 FL=1
MRSYNSHFNSHAEKEYKARIGNWLRRGSGGDARHVSPRIVEIVTESFMAGSIRRDEGNPHGSSSPQGAPRPPIPLGTKTKWGKIGAVGTTIGERYYWMVDKTGGVSMIPASTLEDMDGYIRENYESMA